MDHKDMDMAWIDALRDLLDCPVRYARGLSFRENMGGSIEVDMAKSVLSIRSRKVGYRFMAAEAWWILSGKNDVASIAPYSKKISEFSNDGLFFFGSYGPKVVDQLPYVVDALNKDPGSRRAAINIWREKPTDSLDYPCTLSAQWLVRDGELHCIDTMRSSDVWMGTPYDIFNFSCISAFLLLCLRSVDDRFKEIGLGTIRMTCGSQHLYSQNQEAAAKVVADYLPTAHFCYQGCGCFNNVGCHRYAPLNVDEFHDPWDFLNHLELLKDRRDSGHAFMRELLLEKKNG